MCLMFQSRTQLWYLECDSIWVNFYHADLTHGRILLRRSKAKLDLAGFVQFIKYFSGPRPYHSSIYTVYSAETSLQKLKSTFWDLTVSKLCHSNSGLHVLQVVQVACVGQKRPFPFSHFQQLSFATKAVLRQSIHVTSYSTTSVPIIKVTLYPHFSMG